ncbi:hypothetical protein HMPREF1987_01225 [Peptostreptococcaceae bacterium oral taxon 113 str. W5053]|nr:hypothetical protein HMPREF1987_01225 [Peptostreptococcaceae bacterium oral taxon 113 str. W5053]
MQHKGDNSIYTNSAIPKFVLKQVLVWRSLYIKCMIIVLDGKGYIIMKGIRED